MTSKAEDRGTRLGVVCTAPAPHNLCLLGQNFAQFYHLRHGLELVLAKALFFPMGYRALEDTMPILGKQDKRFGF